MPAGIACSGASEGILRPRHRGVAEDGDDIGMRTRLKTRVSLRLIRTGGSVQVSRASPQPSWRRRVGRPEAVSRVIGGRRRVLLIAQEVRIAASVR